MGIAAYLRVSTGQQSVDQQHEAIEAAGITPDRVFTDTAPGRAESGRPGWEMNMTARVDDDLGYTKICAALSARFGTRFRVARIGECTTLGAKFEGGVEVMITDCGESLSPVDWHMDGRAAGYYVGLHTITSNLDGVDEDILEQVGYACDPDALPTVEAIGALVYQALAYARSLREAT